MSEKEYSIKKIVKDIRPEAISGILISWEGLANGDTGKPYECWMHSDKSVQLIGTLGTGGKCVIEGSNMDASPTWTTLSDLQGNLLEFTALKIKAILENPYQIRPNIMAGDGTTSLNVYMIMK